MSLLQFLSLKFIPKILAARVLQMRDVLLEALLSIDFPTASTELVGNFLWWHLGDLESRQLS
jgi:hypothetical protein